MVWTLKKVGFDRRVHSFKTTCRLVSYNCCYQLNILFFYDTIIKYIFYISTFFYCTILKLCILFFSLWPTNGKIDPAVKKVMHLCLCKKNHRFVKIRFFWSYDFQKCWFWLESISFFFGLVLPSPKSMLIINSWTKNRKWLQENNFRTENENSSLYCLNWAICLRNSLRKFDQKDIIPTYPQDSFDQHHTPSLFSKYLLY